MRDKRCFICKYLQKHVIGTDRDQLFGNQGQTVNINLCYSHSVELFKQGQASFVSKYYEKFQGQYGFEDEQVFQQCFNESRKRFLGNWFNRAS